MTGAASPEFQDQLTDFLPKMRIWALALTRNRTAAVDLVQEVAMKVLMACDSYVPGTNFQAWVHRIMVNQFITNVRRQRGIQRSRSNARAGNTCRPGGLDRPP